jgi:hypothetical protein
MLHTLVRSKKHACVKKLLQTLVKNSLQFAFFLYGPHATFIEVSGNTQGQVWEASEPLSGAAQAHLLPELGPSKGVNKHARYFIK